MTWRGDLGSSTGALGVLDSRGQEGPIGIGTGHRSATDFSNFSLQKGGRKVSRVQVDDTSPKVKEYLGFEVLEGEVGNSFYGSRLGSSFRCVVSADRGDTATNCQILFGFPRFSGDLVLWIFNDNDNCNVNDNGINNGNGGETL